jgi:uncharacterized protein (TIGR03435 family)
MSVLVESSIRAVLIAGGVAAVVGGLRIANARARHAAWLGVLVGMLLLPAFCAWGPKATLRVLPGGAAAAHAGPGPAPVQKGIFEAVLMRTVAARSEVAPAPVRPNFQLVWMVYLLATGLLMARAAYAIARTAQIRRRARPEGEFMSSPECACPVTLGCFRPVVVLPSTWKEWPEAELAAVLEHERGHVRRRDPLVRFVALVNRCIFWFHPLAWWLENRLAVLAEEDCDAAVIASGHDPRDYSEYLIRQARAVERAGTRIAFAGAALGGGVLSHRIQRLLEGPPAEALSRFKAIAGTVFCVVAIGGFTVGRLGRAQQSIAGQSAQKLEFEVASLKPTAFNPDVIRELGKTGQLKFGVRVYGTRAEYNYLSLRQFVAEAYQVRPFQVVCPDWFMTERFDVLAKMPRGSRKEDAPFMLQSLLAERFKLAVHREAREADVAGLVLGNGGPRLKESPSEAQSDANLASSEKPVQSASGKDHSNTRFMMLGAVGMLVTMDHTNSCVHIQASGATMTDLAHVLWRADLGNGRPVVDMTGLKGKYDIDIDIPMSLMGITPSRNAGVESANAQTPAPAEAASDPGIGRMMRSLKSMGLDLKKMKAPLDHIVVDRCEKTPTEN